VTANLTVTNQTAAGFVTAGDQALAKPLTSTINFPLGDIRANGINVPVDDHGRLWFVDRTAPGRTVQLVLDLSGYFEAPAP
jgi:streptogramin lyase